MASSALILSLFLFISTSAVVYATQPPAQPPAHPPHHHHHHHAHPPTPPPSPSHPPAHPPSPTTPPTHLPTPPPAHPPATAPAKPPSQAPPVKPPSTPDRKLVAVQGVVYCKSCKYRGVDTLMGAIPLPGSGVKLQCNNTKYGLLENTKTDKNGYFFFMPQKLTTSGSHKCKVFLVSSPLPTCNVTTNLHGGAAGAILVPPSQKPPVDAKPQKFVLYTVGPFAFEPHKKLLCH